MLTPDTFPSLFWGYTIIWLILVAYIFLLRRKINQLQEKILTDENN